MRSHDEHETTGAPGPMDILVHSLDAGKSIGSLPRGLVSGLMRHAGYRVEMEPGTDRRAGRRKGKSDRNRSVGRLRAPA